MYRKLSKLAKVEFVSGSFDDSPQGKFTLTVMLAAAELERDMISERTQRGRERRVREGRYIAGPNTPYGYKWAGDTLVEDPDTAAVVRQIFAWAAKDNDGLKEDRA